MSKTGDFYLEVSEIMSDLYKLSLDYNNVLSAQSALSAETLSSFKNELDRLGDKAKSILDEIGVNVDTEIYY